MKTGRKREIPNKRCADCRRMRRPRRWVDFYRPTWCCSQRCSNRRLYRAGHGDVLIAGTKARHRREKRARVEAAVHRKFGELSVREIDLFNLGHKVGYARGYARAWKQQRKAAA